MINYASKNLALQSSQRRSLLRIVLDVLILLVWAIAGLAVVAIVTVAFAMLFRFKLFLYVAPVFVLFLLLVWANTMRRIRRRRAEVVLGYVEHAVRLNLPLPPMLLAAELSESPPIARQLGQLANLLTAGTPLAAALEYAVPQLPARQRQLVAAGERGGILAGSLYRILREKSSAPIDPTTAIFYRIYPVVMLLVGGGAISLLAVFVMPKFEQIFRDFGTRMPRLTIVVMNLLETVAIPLLVVVGILLLLLLARAMADIFLPPRYQVELGRPIVERLAWWLPVSHGAARDRGLADACVLLADLLDAGMTLESALDEAAQLRINLVLRRRLRAWRQAIVDGQPVDQAARSARLPRLLVGMLASGKGRTDLPAVFRFLSRYYAARFSRTRILLEGAVVPAIVFLMAGIVLAIALSMFLPIVNLIEVTRLSTGYL